MGWLIEQPRWLWIAALALPCAWIALRWFVAMSGVRRAVSILLRAALLACVALLLSGLSVSRQTNALAVIAVVDVSGSVERFFDVGGEGVGERVRAYLREASRGQGLEDSLGVVAFDGRASVIATPSRGRAWDRPWQVAPREGTNIAEAIRLARAIIPPDSAARILLFTDANATAGDAVAACGEFASASGARGGGRVDVVPLSYKLDSEVLVEMVDAPPGAPAEAAVNIRVVLSASAPSRGTLLLLREGQPVDLNGSAEGTGRRIELRPGRNVELIELELPPGRVHRFKAVYEPDPITRDGTIVLSGDTVSENNSGQAFTITPGRGSVLLVDGLGAGEQRGTLARALERAGLEVQVVSPDSMPLDFLALQAYDIILLENVGAYTIPSEIQDRIVAFVRDAGGGLVMIGGPDSFGPGGWKGTKVAEILPVLLDIPDRIIAPRTATVLVMDNSGSMRRSVMGSMRSQQQIANEAAALAVLSLEGSDLVGVVVFNSAASVVVPLGPNSDAQATADRVRAISAGGGTDMAEGLERAIEEFERLSRQGVDVRTRQVIVLSDGKSQRENELPALVNKLVGMGVRVTTIAVGDDADERMLERLAQQGGGAYFFAANPNALPRIFVKAVRVVSSPLIREGAFEPVQVSAGSPMIAGLGPAPVLHGLVLTRPRPEPTVSIPMLAPTGEPLLAHWSVGLGQVVAFTSDAHKWAREWVDWPGYERMWSQIVRAASRSQGPGEVRASTRTDGEHIVVRAELIDESLVATSDLRIPATVFTPSGVSRDVTLTRVAPGTYEARMLAEETGSYVALVKPRTATRRLTPAIVGMTVQEGAEYRARESDDAYARRLAQAGRGRVLSLDEPAAARLFSREGIPPAEAVTPLWRVLMIVSLVLLVVDVACRRVAWDRWVSRRFRPRSLTAESAARAGAAVQSVAGLRARAGRQGDALRPADALALDQRDAEALARAAKDRRRAERLGQVAAQMRPPTLAATQDNAASAQSEGDSEQGEGLLAAKKRAARRFGEDG